MTRAIINFKKIFPGGDLLRRPTDPAALAVQAIRSAVPGPSAQPIAAVIARVPLRAYTRKNEITERMLPPHQAVRRYLFQIPKINKNLISS